MKNDREELLIKFRSAPRADLKLSAAIEFFLLNAENSPSEVIYYLRKRIRPVIEFLITENRPGDMKRFLYFDCISCAQTDELIETAIEMKRVECLILLLKMKTERFGYHDREMQL